MTRYAASTDVTSEKSRAEIEATLKRYGATGFAYGWEADRAAVQFAIEGRRIRFALVMPDRDGPEFAIYRHSSGKMLPRSKKTADGIYEQACRQRWRALALVIKAKLEAVAAGISCIEDEFMAHVVMPDGRTVGEYARPRIAAAYETGTMQPLLPGPRE